jgi:hypothetical protein
LNRILHSPTVVEDLAAFGCPKQEREVICGRDKRTPLIENLANDLSGTLRGGVAKRLEGYLKDKTFHEEGGAAY